MISQTRFWKNDMRKHLKAKPIALCILVASRKARLTSGSKRAIQMHRQYSLTPLALKLNYFSERTRPSYCL